MIVKIELSYLKIKAKLALLASERVFAGGCVVAMGGFEPPTPSL